MKNKLDLAVPQLSRLFSEDDDEDRPRDEDEYERWEKLFE